MPSSFVNRIRIPTPFFLKAIIVGWVEGAERRRPTALSERWASVAPLPRRTLLFQLLPPQQVVVMLGEAVGLVTDVLQQPQRRRVSAQADRLGIAGAVNLLVPLGQRHDRRRLDA